MEHDNKTKSARRIAAEFAKAQMEWIDRNGVDMLKQSLELTIYNAIRKAEADKGCL